MDWQAIFTTGLFAGIAFGLVPMIWAFRHQKYRLAVTVLLISALGGFSLNIIGGLFVAILALSVVISYTYINKSDPFTSRAKSIDEVSFEESDTEFALRQMSALGQWLRGTGHMLVRNKGGFIGFAGILFFIFMTAFGPLFIDYDGAPHIERRQPGANSLFQEPSLEFPLGLDWQGRDILSHIVYGGTTLIVTAVQAGLMATVIAVVLGSTAALVGGIIDLLLNAIANFILTIPRFPLLIVLASVLDFNSNFLMALLLAALTWPGLMRAVRAQVLSLRERDYVEAAIALDLGLWHIISCEVFPNMVSYIAINLIFSIRAAMYGLVGLIILGMVPLVEPDWGIMIWNSSSKGAFYNSRALMMALAPITAISLFQLSLILFTRSLEEVFNPRLRQGL